MQHLLRAGLLLGLLLGGVIYAHALSTVVTVDSLGLTHDDNARAWAERPVNNQEAQICADCHKETAEWKSSIHVKVTCEDCHGATREHVLKARSGQVIPLPLTDARYLCLMCHAKTPGRPSSFPQVDSATHPDQIAGLRPSCATCHTPHNPGIPLTISHNLDGRSMCLNCHGKDQWKPLPDDHAKRTNEMCLTCHQPKEVK
jgi:hypothetical protein